MNLIVPRNIRIRPRFDFTLPTDKVARFIETKEVVIEVTRAFNALSYGERS